MKTSMRNTLSDLNNQINKFGFKETATKFSIASSSANGGDRLDKRKVYE